MLGVVELFVAEVSFVGVNRFWALVSADGFEILLKRLPPLFWAIESLVGLG